ncbi:WD40-repeat containing protein [Gracilaria domingensis]|nr:WD40-repeat containing protein [Gracilaria domingensis]
MSAMLLEVREHHNCGLNTTVFVETNVFLGSKLNSSLVSKCASHPPPAFISRREPRKQRVNRKGGNALVSMQREFDVFISHAGEDKDTIAMPLYTSLQTRGMTPFLDREELREGEHAPREMIRAMETSPVGLFILSPEFAAKKWTMLELDCFLQRVEKADVVNDGRTRPALIPVFYRLTVADCRYAQLFRKYREVLLTTDFFERVEAGHTTSTKVKSSLSSLSANTGISNHIGATNEDSEAMMQIRLKFVEQICERVERAVQRITGSTEGRDIRLPSSIDGADAFKPYFYIPQLAKEVLLDFDGIDNDGNPATCEGIVLRELLMKDDVPGATRVISVLGSPGVGKSCILRALAGNKDVKTRFPNGIYYMLLGVDATEGTIVQELLKVLRCSGGHTIEKLMREEWSLDIVIEKVAEWMRGKTYLLLVDDVWDDGTRVSTISSLLGVFGDNTHSSMVFTTRQESIAVLGDVVKIEPLQPCSEEAKDMLLRYAKLPELSQNDSKLMELVRNVLVGCGGLPVCLAAVGRGIARQTLHYQKRKELAMEVYYDQLKSGNRNVVDLIIDGYPGLSAAYLASLTFLGRHCRTILGFETDFSLSEMHRSFSVFERQAIIPHGALRRLWNLKDDTEAILVLEAFVEVGLADVEVDYETGRKQLRLHDLAHDFACACAERMGESQIWHQRLLDGYMADQIHCDRNRPWWELEDDGYIYNNISRHLLQSGREEEALQLILNASWTLRRHDCGGLRSCMRDFDISMRAITRSASYSTEAKQVLTSGLSLVKHAVRDSWSVVDRNQNEFCFQMHGRLLAVVDSPWPVNAYLSSLRAVQSASWLKPAKGYFGQPGQQRMKEFVMNSHVIAVTDIFPGTIAAVTRNEVVTIEVDDMLWLVHEMAICRYGI